MPFRPFGHGPGARELDTAYDDMHCWMYVGLNYDAPAHGPPTVTGLQVDRLVDMLRAWMRRALDPALKAARLLKRQLDFVRPMSPTLKRFKSTPVIYDIR